MIASRTADVVTIPCEGSSVLEGTCERQMHDRKWSSGAPCAAGDCFVGFSWESDGTRPAKKNLASQTSGAGNAQAARGELQVDTRHLSNSWLHPPGREVQAMCCLNLSVSRGRRFSGRLCGSRVRDAA